MAYFLVGLIAGLLATPHCAGMCGLFPLYLARSTAGGRPFVRQLLYLGGKTLTCAFLGVLAGTLGQAVVERLFTGSSSYLLAYAFGAAMLAIGVAMLGILPPIRLLPSRVGDDGLLRMFCSQFAATPGPLASLLLGVATGFLPCGITMGMLAFAVATRSPLLGMVAMIGLGLGTSPVLLGIGLSASLLDSRLRLIGLRAAGVLMVLLGILAFLRPAGVLCQFLPGEASWSFIQKATPQR